jgi:D-glycero-alpha-D-manno-heptose 1-phosphate guanylyltransferase
VVSDVPKPLAPVAGRPFLHWLLDTLAAGGIRRVVLATGYLGEMVEAAVGAGHAGMAVSFVREEAPLGTGGALWAAMGCTEGERVFALNGDTWLGVDFAAMARAAPEADLVFAVRPVPDRSRYGSVVLDGDRLVGLREKDGSGPGLVNGGTYLLRRGLLEKRPLPGPSPSRRRSSSARKGSTSAPFPWTGASSTSARRRISPARRQCCRNGSRRPGEGARRPGQRSTSSMLRPKAATPSLRRSPRPAMSTR